MEINQYFALIDKCAATTENFTIPNSEPIHAAYLLKTLFKNAHATIRIFTGHLFEDVYGDTELQEEACNFLAKDVNNLIRIAYQESNARDKVVNSTFVQKIVNDDQKKGSITLWQAKSIQIAITILQLWMIGLSGLRLIMLIPRR